MCYYCVLYWFIAYIIIHLGYVINNYRYLCFIYVIIMLIYMLQTYLIYELQHCNLKHMQYLQINMFITYVNN